MPDILGWELLEVVCLAVENSFSRKHSLMTDEWLGACTQAPASSKTSHLSQSMGVPERTGTKMYRLAVIFSAKVVGIEERALDILLRLQSLVLEV